MRKSRFTDEQIIQILQASEAVAATQELCRKHGISPGTFQALSWTPPVLNSAKRLAQS